MNRPNPTAQASRILEITRVFLGSARAGIPGLRGSRADRAVVGSRVVLTDGPYNEMMAGHAETGWRHSFEKLAKSLSR